MNGHPGPSVTVSLVTYNGMRWLPGCLASLRAQALGDYELLVLDNGSTDGSREWLRDYADREPRMRLTESDVNLGFAAAHNRHIGAAAADLVLPLYQHMLRE
jgi:GT2 family glycosyltransferase